MVLGAKAGDKHLVGIGLNAQLPEHGDAVAGIAGDGEPMDGGLAAEEVKLAVFLQHFVVPTEAAAGQHHGLTVNVDFAAGILSDHAGDLAVVVQLQMLCRSGGEDFHGQIVPLDGV